MLAGGSPDGEDILHQAFLLAFDRLADGDQTIEHMGKWLRGVVRNLIRGWWREKRRLPESLVDRLHELAETADNATSVCANDELAAALERCLGQLAPTARRFVVARYEKGLPINPHERVGWRRLLRSPRCWLSEWSSGFGTRTAMAS